jgi:hypothetical protein
LAVAGGPGRSDSGDGDAATIEVEDFSSGDGVVGPVLRRGATCSAVVAELTGVGTGFAVEEIATAAEAGGGGGFIRTTEMSGAEGGGFAPGIETMAGSRVVSNCSAKTST